MLGRLQREGLEDDARELAEDKSTEKIVDRLVAALMIRHHSGGAAEKLLVELAVDPDFENDDFDFWFGPEFGKIITDGFIIYGKPGWGVDPDPEDREFTFEIGARYFF